MSKKALIAKMKKEATPAEKVVCCIPECTCTPECTCGCGCCPQKLVLWYPDSGYVKKEG